MTARVNRPHHKTGRKPNTPEQQIIAKARNRSWRNNWLKEYTLENPQKRLLYTARARAKRKGLDCTISEDDIQIPETCPYLGIPLALRASRGTPRTQVMSLDRINSDKGYVIGNVEVISWQANTMKNNASIEQLQQFALAILERYPVD